MRLSGIRRAALRPAGLLVGVLAGVVALGCRRSEASPNAAAEGKHLYDSACARCHGSDGRGGVPMAEGVAPPRNFFDSEFQASRSDADLESVIRHGKGAMPPFGKLFDEQQTALLVAHIRSFKPKTRP